MKDSQDYYVQIGQINTRYWVQGDHGSTVLLVHGLGGFIENWQPSFSTLATQHRVYALDWIGHGLTDKPLSASYRVTDLAAFVKDFMMALGLDRVSLVGHSLGGAVVLQLALTFPSMVTRLVLVDSAGLGKEAAFALRLLSLPILGEMLSRPSRSGTIQTLKLYTHDPAYITDELIDLHYQKWAQVGAQQTFLKTLRAAGNLSGQLEDMYGPIVRGLPSLKIPALVVWGRHDQAIPVSHAQVAAERLLMARVQIFDNCGHNPMVEQTEAFNILLREFLAD